MFFFGVDFWIEELGFGGAFSSFVQCEGGRQEEEEEEEEED